MRRLRFERYFARVLPASGVTPRRLHAAMRYGALSAGKRLRPLLALTACEAVGGRWTGALPAAAAVECVHAYSLIHDDLPAMDDDDYRRGKLTTHKKYGEALAILAGDALLALAFEELTRLERSGVSPQRIVQAMRRLAVASGSCQLVGGQAMDLEAEGRSLKPPAVEDIHVRKTGALISASLYLGGLAGDGTNAQLNHLTRIGFDVGLAFQIHDDLLNRHASLRRLGKRTGTDETKRKATYPGAVGDERAAEAAGLLIDGALTRARSLGARARNLERLITGVAKRSR